MTTSLSLKKNKAFWALFGTQFFGAFNDNFFRTAFITLLTYHCTTVTEHSKSLFVSAAFGVFMLPFFLFSPFAGQLADHFDKGRTIRYIKVAEILIVSISSYGFIQKNPYFLLGALFCMGTHSAFFGPAKYGLMPEILPYKSLLKGNGLMEAGTFLSVLGGMLMGALLIYWELSPLALCLYLLGVALTGFCISCYLPSHPHKKTPFQPRFSWFRELKYLYHFTRQDSPVFIAIIGIAWFWLVGSLLMSHLPSFAKDLLHVEESVFIAFLLLFTIGIGAGSVACQGIFKGEITPKYTPWIVAMMAFPLFDLSTFNTPLPSAYRALGPFLGTGEGIRLVFDIFSLSALGGLYVVPLYSFLQVRVSSTHLAQVVAFNNILIAGFMVFISALTFGLRAIDISLSTLIQLSVAGQFILAVYTLGLLPGGSPLVKIKRLVPVFANLFKSEGISFRQDRPRKDPNETAKDGSYR